MQGTDVSLSCDYTDLVPLFAGYEKCAPEKSFGPAIRKHYLVHYVVSGEGFFECNGKTYHVNEGEIFLIRPGELTVYYTTKENPWCYVWIGFTGRLAKRLDKLEVPVKAIRGSAFNELAREHSNGRISTELCASVLFLMYSQLFEPKKDTQSYVSRIADYIECNYMADISAEKLAKMINLDRRYASRLFKAEYGVPMGRYIVQYRMKRAKEFLSQGYSVAQTAKLVGYQDVFNFSKMFKRTYGRSPSNYKSIN